MTTAIAGEVVKGGVDPAALEPAAYAAVAGITGQIPAREHESVAAGQLDQFRIIATALRFQAQLSVMLNGPQEILQCFSAHPTYACGQVQSGRRRRWVAIKIPWREKPPGTELLR